MDPNLRSHTSSASIQPIQRLLPVIRPMTKNVTDMHGSLAWLSEPTLMTLDPAVKV